MLRFEEDDDRCEIARDILIKMGSTAVPSLIEALKHKNKVLLLLIIL